jgi:hypothetical protein
MIRQGDVLLIPIPSAGDELHRCNRVVLARGATTGHAHEIRPGPDGRLSSNEILLHDILATVIRVEGQCFLYHPEHNPDGWEIPPGFYEVRRQRVYTPQDSRLVAD